jgi:hypothetical protein
MPTGGFTVVELLIATAVFAMVLLIAQTSFVHIGNLFYRGISITNTQEVADHIFQDINGNFQNAGAIGGSQNSPAGGYDYYCIGNTRYTYRINQQTDTSAVSTRSPSGNYGILKDRLAGAGNACNAPCDPPSGNCTSGITVPFNNPVELLGDKMRVEQFSVAQSTTTSNLYNVAIVLAYGDSDNLTYSDPADFSTASCKAEAQNTFCAVSRVNTAVYNVFHK